MDKKTMGGCVLVVLSCTILGLSVSAQEDTFDNPIYQQVMERLENLMPGDTIDVRMGTEKDRYQIDNPLEIRFQVSKACYIVLMNISVALDTSSDPHRYIPGDITFFLPNYKFPDTKIEGNRVYSTLHDFKMNIKTAPPYGTETINLFCSPEKLDLFDADFGNEGYYIIKPDDEPRLKTLLARLDQLEEAEWSGNSVSIQIGLTRGKYRKFGVLPPFGATGTTGKTEERFFPPLDSTGTP